MCGVSAESKVVMGLIFLFKDQMISSFGALWLRQWRLHPWTGREEAEGAGGPALTSFFQHRFDFKSDLKWEEKNNILLMNWS